MAQHSFDRGAWLLWEPVPEVLSHLHSNALDAGSASILQNKGDQGLGALRIGMAAQPAGFHGQTHPFIFESCMYKEVCLPACFTIRPFNVLVYQNQRFSDALFKVENKDFQKLYGEHHIMLDLTQAHRPSQLGGPHPVLTAYLACATVFKMA